MKHETEVEAAGGSVGGFGLDEHNAKAGGCIGVGGVGWVEVKAGGEEVQDGQNLPDGNGQ